MDFNASLLREKFVIREKASADDLHPLEFIAPSTRMVVTLKKGNLAEESLVLRTHNMHTTVRMAVQIVKNYERHGPIEPRAKSIDWEEMWLSQFSHYEMSFINNKRMSLYKNGKRLFSHGNYHPFLDIIEKCDHINKEEYAQSITMAQNAFMQAGKDVTIDYCSNVALIVMISDHEERASMVMRGFDGKSTTFNLTIKPPEKDQKIDTAQVMSSAADFLEGLQLSFTVGLNNEKLRQGAIEKYSHEDKMRIKAHERMNSLSMNIDAMENRYKTRYRPERPDFHYHMKTAQKQASKTDFVADKDEQYIT